MRASTNISLKERKQLQLMDFKGVDFSSSPLRVQSNRAAEMTNFINVYGVNRKRNGWDELLKIEAGDKPLKINGIFEYDFRSRKEMIVYAGTRFFRIFSTEKEAYLYEDITFSSTYAPARCDGERLKDSRIQVFYDREKAYIIGCGDFLVYGSFDEGNTYELRRVAQNTDTKIPTTTVSIDDDSITGDTDREVLDNVNMLSDKRINQLVGSEEANKFWTLDCSIDEGTEVSIVLETIRDGKPVTVNISNSGQDKTQLFEGNTLVGSVDFAGGRINLTIKTPHVRNRDNIFVTFCHRTEGFSDRISNCGFGVLFGVNGNTDRLFLSGNEAFPNVDFYSEAGDYTYFPDRNAMSMGSDSVPIMGYQRLSDSTLAIFKASSGREASIFYRTGLHQSSYDSNGELTYSGDLFPTSAGSIGEGAVSRYAFANLGGDSLILSENGVFGIVLANNIATAERYTRERSRSVNERLKKHEKLSEAVGIVYRDKYYLAVENVCYVADARFKYTDKNNLDGSFNYEWWFWENIPARVFANIDGRLFFGTAEGQVCVFDDEYTDRTYDDCKSGELVIDQNGEKLSFGKDITVTEDDRLIFCEEEYALFLEGMRIEGDKIRVSEAQIRGCFNGLEVYADRVGDSGLKTGTRYILADVDIGDCTFRLLDVQMTEQKITSAGFRLHKRLTDIELYFTDITEDDFRLKEYKSGSAIILSDYDGHLSRQPIARIVHRKNVVARWYSPVFDMGTSESSKALLKMTISTEPEINGKLSFGYETKRVAKNLNAKGIHVFSFEDLSFENFTFDTGFASSYSVKCNQRNFNFIQFHFISDNDSDCAVNTFTALYKINRRNQGVK